MNSETIRFIDAIARDRNVDRELLLRDLEQAMISAARKHFNSLDTEEFACKVDPISGAEKYLTVGRGRKTDHDRHVVTVSECPRSQTPILSGAIRSSL